MIVFIYALCLPFMVIAYFLRGIAMGDMFLVALAMLPPLLVATQAGILVGSAGKRWLIGVFCLAMFFFGQPAALFFAAFLWGLFRGTESAGAIIFLWCVFCAILLGLLYALSVAAVSSRFSNRMLPVRLFLVGTFVCSPLIGARRRAGRRHDGRYREGDAGFSDCGRLDGCRAVRHAGGVRAARPR